MLLPPSLNTISLEINPDKFLFIYPVTLIFLCGASLYLTDTFWWVKGLILIITLICVLLFSYKTILLERAESIIKIEYKQQQWFLFRQDRIIQKAVLSTKTVFLPFIVFLFFRVEGKYKSVIVRRSHGNTAQYDALYVYLKYLWQ